jgi:hypothetical protein
MIVFRLIKYFLCLTLFFVFSASAELYRNRDVQINFPDSVGDLLRNPEIFDYEKIVPGLGESIAYNSDGVTSTIYIYRIGQNISPDEAGSVRIQDHLVAAVGEVMKMQEAGQYQNVALLTAGEFSWQDKLKPTKSLFAKFSYQQNGTDRLSYLHVLGYRGRVLKVRHTFGSDYAQKGEKLHLDILRMIGQQLID